MFVGLKQTEVDEQLVDEEVSVDEDGAEADHETGDVRGQAEVEWELAEVSCAQTWHLAATQCQYQLLLSTSLNHSHMRPDSNFQRYQRLSFSLT